MSHVDVAARALFPDTPAPTSLQEAQTIDATANAGYLTIVAHTDDVGSHESQSSLGGRPPPNPSPAAIIAESTVTPELSASAAALAASSTETPEPSLKPEVKEPIPAPVPLNSLLRFVSPVRYVLFITTAVVGSFLKGAAWPIWSLLFGSAISAFADGKDPVAEVQKLALYFIYTAIGAGLGDAISVMFVHPFGCTNVLAVQAAYLRSVLSQEIAWHETMPGPSLDQRAITAWPELLTLLTVKFRIVLENLSMGSIAFIIAFIKSWKLSLVFLAILPLQMVMYGLIDLLVRGGDGKKSKLYEKAASIAHETLTLIRCVITFGTHAPELQRYEVEIRKTAHNGYKTGFILAAVQGAADAISFCMYAVAFWFGAKLLRDKDIGAAGDIIVVLFSCIIGAAGVGQCLGNFAQFRQSQV